MYDQMYWTLTFGDTQHHNPVTLNPGMKEYTIFIDGISKVFAATGVRVGWSMGPAHVLGKMKAINSHVGAWAPMAEQKAVAKYLLMEEPIRKYLDNFKSEIHERLERIYTSIQELKGEGYKVDAVTPQAAIYLTVKFNLVGKTTTEGATLANQEAVTSYLLNEAKMAIVPFYAFGAGRDSNWYRLSVGTCRKEEIDEMLSTLKLALRKLK
jgi:aspartate aminotransferase